MFVPRPPRIAALVRGAGVSLAVLSAPVHRGSLANAQGALFDRRRGELADLRDWRELEPRLAAVAARPGAGETG